MKNQKLLQKLLSGSKNISFTDVETVAKSFGFELKRINGSHHIYEHPQVLAMLNIQNVHGQAKPYQIKQLLEIIERFNLKMED